MLTGYIILYFSRFRQYSLPNESLTNQKPQENRDCDIHFKEQNCVSANASNSQPSVSPFSLHGKSENQQTAFPVMQGKITFILCSCV